MQKSFAKSVVSRKGKPGGGRSSDGGGGTVGGSGRGCGCAGTGCGGACTGPPVLLLEATPDSLDWPPSFKICFCGTSNDTSSSWKTFGKGNSNPAISQSMFATSSRLCLPPSSERQRPLVISIQACVMCLFCWFGPPSPCFVYPLLTLKFRRHHFAGRGPVAAVILD